MSERCLRERNVFSMLRPSSANTIAIALMSFLLNLFCSLPLHAQAKAPQPPTTKSQYDQGYEAGYLAGLRAAAASASSNITPECDADFSFGADLRGDWWRRPNDKFGVAFVEDGLSANHRRYLSLGGLGFILGDGALSYGPEQVMESYYNFPIPVERGVFGAFDIQYINNPGYNRARGPVVVPGVRLHLEL